MYELLEEEQEEAMPTLNVQEVIPPHADQEAAWVIKAEKVRYGFKKNTVVIENVKN